MVSEQSWLHSSNLSLSNSLCGSAIASFSPHNMHLKQCHSKPLHSSMNSWTVTSLAQVETSLRKHARSLPSLQSHRSWHGTICPRTRRISSICSAVLSNAFFCRLLRSARVSFVGPAVDITVAFPLPLALLLAAKISRRHCGLLRIGKRPNARIDFRFKVGDCCF
ncbi:uncharacterized protein B0T15DRAFT_530556 [Chaetomium strumarium]|uniref:Uncharacterized protein n=1 Tax=Chaetomium strumarium TaxID=1170767 RepID=A0AAJ0GWP9_9PEZI|nr:hypothetical protein B0T15DRAFT_530556 [Chaetomium strumarium]